MLAGSSICLLVHPFTHPTIRPLIGPFARWFVHLLVGSFICSHGGNGIFMSCLSKYYDSIIFRLPVIKHRGQHGGDCLGGHFLSMFVLVHLHANADHFCEREDITMETL